MFAADEPTVHGGSGVLTDQASVFTPRLTLPVWRLLARLAHANQSAKLAAQRSTPHMPESTANHRAPERTAA